MSDYLMQNHELHRYSDKMCDKVSASENTLQYVGKKPYRASIVRGVMIFKIITTYL